MAKEFNKVFINSEKGIRFSNRDKLVNLLKSNNFLLNEEENEFRLSGETRNCVVHNGGQVDEKWVKTYEKARGKSTYKIGDDLKFIATLEEVEKWHNLFLNITERIEQKSNIITHGHEL